MTEAGDEAVLKLRDELKAQGLRVSMDTRNEKLGFKVREAQLAKVPYILVVGEKEVQAGGANVRLRNGDNLGLKSVGDIAALIRADAEGAFQTKEGCAIASPNMRPRREMPQDGVRRNELIRAREVRVIGADGEQLGILPT